MPRIPVVSAEGRSAVTQLPGRVAAEDYGGAAQLGAAASNAGAVFTDIAVKLDRQKSDLLARMDQQEGELQGAQATQSLDTGLHRLSTEVLSDPTIPNPVEAFTERANALHRQIRDAATRPDVQRHVDRYAARALGVSTLKVEDEALKLQAGRHLGMLDETVRTLARQAGDTADPAEFDRKMQAARQHIDNATKRNYLTPKQASDLRQATEDEMLQANMVKVGRESRATLVRDELAGRWNALPQGKRLAALNEAREREDRVSAKIDKDFRELQRLTKDKLEALATAGTLSPSLLAEGQAGLNPVLTDASYWRHLEGINSGAWRPKQKNVAVEVLLDGFYSGAITVPRIDTTWNGSISSGARLPARTRNSSRRRSPWPTIGSNWRIAPPRRPPRRPRRPCAGRWIRSRRRSPGGWVACSTRCCERSRKWIKRRCGTGSAISCRRKGNRRARRRTLRSRN